MSKQRYPGIDIVKLLCAFLVIAIHTQPFIQNIWLDRGVGIVTRVAVPFFFMATGFLLFDDSFDSGKLKRYMKHILILYAVWSLIYLPFVWPLEHIARAVLNTGISDHLWYVPALIFSVVLIFLLRKVLSNTAIVILSAFFLLAGIMLSTYKSVISEAMGGDGFLLKLLKATGTRNGLFFGFFYVSLGMKVREADRSRTSSFYAALLFIGFCFLAIESYYAILYLQATETIMWLTCPIPVYALFMLARGIETGLDTGLLRKMSSFIYFSHYLWIYILRLMEVTEGAGMFLAVTAVCFFTSYVVVRLANRIRVFGYLF